MILIIDPTSIKTLRFFLLDQDCVLNDSKVTKSQKALEELDSFLRKNHCQPEKIKILGIFEGAGSFTALRNIAAIANVWQNTYDLKVFGIDTKEAQKRSVEQIAKGLFKKKAKAKIFIPKYAGPPNIIVKKNFKIQNPNVK